MDMMQGLLLMVLTVYHEARGEPDIGQRGIVKVIINRAEIKEVSIKTIILEKKQFSFLNSGLNDNFDILIDDVNTALKISINVLTAISEWNNGDRLKGATHYYAIKRMHRKKPPYWATNMKIVAKHGKHRFLKEKLR